MGIRKDGTLANIGEARRNGRDIYELTRDYTFKVTIGGIEYEITAPKGFQTDLLSPPSNILLRLIAWPLDLNDTDLDDSTLPHDWLCWNQRDYPGKAGKAFADKVLRQRMRDTGIGWYRRFWIYHYVRLRAMRVKWGQPKLPDIVLP